MNIDIAPDLGEDQGYVSPNRLWRSCCVELDKQAVVYFAQITIGVAVLAFSAVQLLRSNFECNQSAPYLGLISFIIGTYVPKSSSSR